ncbi:hypothetical protein AUC43_15370 [Hymenobacter sedentarius]|uniref:Uncharacterized protein n=1 Tax=Hymenobacter sedentarius TaxID=1411621 RepID=A0A0U4BSC5_9BACT|nr:hypothetical protein [Hymenobacter sedentarius]ALW86343.1 hypothetical protein AUC43_15370 [Hymenobacter sedentarius]
MNASKFWEDVLTNDKKKYSSNAVMRAVVFVLGCCFATAAVVGDFMGVVIRLDPAVLAWSLAFGIAGLRIGEAWLQRKTADSTGAPLLQEGTAVAPSEPVVAAPPVSPANVTQLTTPTEGELADQ